MSQHQTLKHTDFGGFGSGEGYLGGLKDDEFASFCPPDVQPNTRIIAVCGASDTKGFGSPDQDGLFFSDFFLYHHLLENSPTFQAGNQLWLTCANPRSLVSRYGGFVHGSWRGDRRVVLDASMLDRLEQANNIRVFQSMELLQRFVFTLRDEIKVAAELKQPVLVLVFGHGDEETHGVAIGGDFQGTAPRFTMKDFEICLRKDVDVTLMITSCYSGGWVTKPMVRPLRPSRPFFNITAMTAANAEEMSSSWAQAESIRRRAGGSMFATAVMNALMVTSQNTSEFEYMCSAFDSVITETEEGQSLQYEPTYVSLVKAVLEAMKDADPCFWQSHGISFAAKDDRWDLAWRKRTGFPLVNFQNRWEKLRKIPISLASAFGLARGSSAGTLKLPHNILRERAFAYMNSFPGDDKLGGNSVHAQFRLLIDGKKFDDEILTYLDNVLEYRNSLLNLATEFVQFLDLNFADARSFNAKRWHDNNLAQRQSTNLEVTANGRAQLDKFTKVRSLISQKGLFGIPMPQTQGPNYEKPKEYLAIAFTSTNLSLEEIDVKIARLHMLNNAKQYLVTTMPRGRRTMEDREVAKSRKTLREKLGRVGKRLRSISPSKRHSTSTN